MLGLQRFSGGCPLRRERRRGHQLRRRPRQRRDPRRRRAKACGMLLHRTCGWPCGEQGDRELYIPLVIVGSPGFGDGSGTAQGRFGDGSGAARGPFGDMGGRLQCILFFTHPRWAAPHHAGGLRLAKGAYHRGSPPWWEPPHGGGSPPW
eukprot:gene15727-biopygen9738